MQSFSLTFILWVLAVIHCSHPLSAEESFLLLNGKTNEIATEFGPDLNERISPCSTFKIPLSLMGYEAGILVNETFPIWDFQDGYDDWLAFWRTSQTPQSWIQYSCVWYSKILSLYLELGKIQSYLVSMEYGNKDVSGGLAEPGPLDPFWINSSLKISPKEQVGFIQKMIDGKLPISKEAIRMTRTLLFKEDLGEGWKLFGKTGWSGIDVTRDGKTLEHGWFVGWVEKEQQFFPFAYLIREQKIVLEQRVPRVKQLLFESEIMKPITLEFPKH